MLLYTTQFCREAKRKKQYRALKDDDSYVKRILNHAYHLRKMENAYSYAEKFYNELLCVFDKVDVLTSDGREAKIRERIMADIIDTAYESIRYIQMTM